MEMPFEFCALRFLLQWEQREKKLHALMKDNPSRDDIRKSLRYFQVARNFKELKSDNKVDYILNAIHNVSRKQSLSPEAKVTELAKQFKSEFQTFNLSAASKLLWLRYKSPFIVYDSRAVKALKRLGCHFDERNYSKYCDQWKTQYEKHKSEVKTATARLVEIRSFFPVWHQSEGVLVLLISKPWFLERVFDVYLWEKGGESSDDS